MSFAKRILSVGMDLARPFGLHRNTLAHMRDRGRRVARTYRAADGLLPCDIRMEDHQCNHTSHRYDGDVSGTIKYIFNAAGYRGDLPDQNAALRICLIGESHCFGTGVSWESSLAGQLKTIFSGVLDVPEGQVNVVNLGVGGASADHCLRSLMRNVAAVQPDLVIFWAPGFDRIENCTPDHNVNYTMSNVDLERLDEAPIPLQGFCDLYDPISGTINLAKNIQLFQLFCDAYGIEHLTLIRELEMRNFEHHTVRAFSDKLQGSRMLSYQISRNKLDLAADDLHYGPRTHALIALGVAHRIAQLAQDAGQVGWGQPLDAHVAALKALNKDWTPLFAASFR